MSWMGAAQQVTDEANIATNAANVATNTSNIAEIETDIGALEGSVVTSVTAADGTITIGGTATAPTVGVGTIAESKVTNLTSDLAAKVASVTATDSTITIAGTATAPTVGVGTVPTSKVSPDPLARANATGTQTASTISDFTSTVNGIAVPLSTVTTKGDVIAATGNAAVSRLAVGTLDQSLVADSTAATGVKWASPAHLRSAYLKPTAALYETFERLGCSNQAALTSGTLRLQAIALPKGLAVASISFHSGTTPLSAGTHAWFCLYDKNLALLRQSTDDTSPTWGASSLKTYNLSSSYTTTASDLYYIGLCIVGTVPSLFGNPSSAIIPNLPPILCGNSTTGLTTTAPDPALAITCVAPMVYGYVS